MQEMILVVLLITFFVLLRFVAWKARDVALVLPVGEVFSLEHDADFYQERAEKAIKQFRNSQYSKIIILSNEILDMEKTFSMADYVQEILQQENIPCVIEYGFDPPSSLRWEMVEI